MLRKQIALFFHFRQDPRWPSGGTSCNMTVIYLTGTAVSVSAASLTASDIHADKRQPDSQTSDAVCMIIPPGVNILIR